MHACQTRDMTLLRPGVPTASWVTLALGCAFLGVAFAGASIPPVFVSSSLLVAATWFSGGVILHRAMAVGRTPPAIGREGSALRRRPLALGAGATRGRPGAARAYRLAALVALGTVVFFFAGAWVLSVIPWTAGLVHAAAASASWTPLWLTVALATITGWGEETFFRWGLPNAWSRNGQWWALGIYTLSTVFTGNLALVLAAPMLGVVCQFVLNATGRLGAACLVHTGFSLGIVGLVPLVFGT